jgi:hypothetical protein
VAGSLCQKRAFFFLALCVFENVLNRFNVVLADCPGRSGALTMRYTPENVDGKSLDRAM